MVEISDIKDEDSLKAWLENQPHGVSVWIAYRAAARGLPILLNVVQASESLRGDNVTALPFLRCLLISEIASMLQSRDIQSAASHAADALPSWTKVVRPDAFAAGSAINNAVGAVLRDPMHEIAARAALKAADAIADGIARSRTSDTVAAGAFDAADADSWQAVRVDAGYSESRSLFDRLPLWPDGKGPLAEQWRAIKWQVTNSEGAEDWQFWLDWYDEQLAGRTLLPDPARTWDMLEKIALIDPDTWDAGPEVVNAKIREIWESYKGKAPRELEILQAADDGVVLGYNFETDRFYQEDIKAENQSRLQTAVAKLNEVRLLVGQMGNLQGVLTSEMFLIDRAVQDHPENATMVFFNTKAARGLLQANIENGSCPSPQSEPVIGLLDTMLLDTQNTLLPEPAVQVGLKARAEDSSLLDSPESLKTLEDAADDIAEVSEGALADELPENAKKAKDPYQPRAVRVNALISTVSAVVQSWVIAGYARFKTALKELDDISARTARISKNLAVTIGTGGAALYTALQVVTNSPKVEAAIKAIIALF